MRESKTIRVKRDTWVALYDRKRPGDTFDEVISKLIEEAPDIEGGHELVDTQESDA